MKFLRTLVLATLACATLAACSKVPAGHVGVKVYLLGGNKGVDTEELGVGRYWVGWNEELYLFPTFMQNAEWTKDSRLGSETDESFSFQTVDGMVANADIGISYSINPGKVTEIFQKYRRGVDEITDTFLRNMVRDALVKESSAKTIEYIYGAGKSELIDKVQAQVVSQVKDLGIEVSKVYWIGEIRVPQQVMDSINAKTTSTQLTQQRQNEVAQIKAEADKKIEEARGQAEALLRVAEAQAKANKILAQSLTPELVMYLAVEKWSGTTPTTILSDSVVPLLNIGKE